MLPHRFRSLSKRLLAWLLACGCVTLSLSRSELPLWTNSLGMGFANVAVVSREEPDASRARQILMATLETAEKHVAAFRRETGLQPAQHHASADAPAKHVSWNEAVAFCRWLTQRERAAGKITAQQRYRLPTDHEWSCAVGIGQLESVSASPEAKSNVITDRYPWGVAWPPPDGAGNLCGVESQADFPENFIAGFKDLYSGGKVQAQASVPNGLGIHDLSGNLWEWCEDRFREGRDWRVLRGGSWKSARAQTLLSSHRTHDPESYRSDSVGFRCVLADE
jgi:formylglycine-generating enzyme required for sulfatase activity